MARRNGERAVAQQARRGWISEKAVDPFWDDDPNRNLKPDTLLVPCAVASQWRESLLDRFPNLRVHPQALGYRRLFQHILFGSFWDRSSFYDDTCSISEPTLFDPREMPPAGRDTWWPTGHIAAYDSTVVPYDLVAQCQGVNPKSHGFSALRFLLDFSRDVLPLKISEHRYVDGRARVVRPEFPPDVRETIRIGQRRHLDVQWEYESDRPLDPWERKSVWFDTGLPVSRRSLSDRRDEYASRLEEMEDAVPRWHPARRVIHHARRSRARAAREIRRRLGLIRADVAAMPDGPRFRHCARLLAHLDLFPEVYYGDSERTVRLHALGGNPHQFPRELRKKLFGGLIEADLKAAQLSIVAELWKVEPLRVLLRDGRSVWKVLADAADVPLDTHKPLLKRTVYSIVFGMSERNLVKQLVCGVPLEPEVSLDRRRARRLLRHPILSGLMEARAQQIEAVNRAGGLQDAYGRFQVVTRRRRARSILSHVVQSYELRLMEPILDVLDRQPQLYLVSWLHDGVTLLSGNATKSQRYCGQLRDGVALGARRLGFATELEIEGCSGT